MKIRSRTSEVLKAVCWRLAAAFALILTAIPNVVYSQQKTDQQKPNILVIMGDDIGWFNPSCYNRGMMGYETPNIDRIAKEGALFNTWYAQQSCTAGRAAFISGQSPIRTGMTKVGLPGADVGLSPEDPTIAEFLKPLGYATGQFGKNHLGDKNEFLPTVHGFDEFFGNLYHLNAEEEPENPDYPKNAEFHEHFAPRGVLHCMATDTDDPTVDPRFGKVGKQTIEDTGPLTKKRMETVDEEFLKSALDFMDREHKAGKPFFCWFNSTRMHIWTHLKPESNGKTGLGLEADGMVEHDGMVGQLLKKLDDLGITDNTIVVYTTDNGAEVMTWPDAGTTPFRGEKATNWEGGYRVPTVIRWPRVIKPGTIYNDIFAHMDFLPTFLAAAGDPDVVTKCLKGDQVGNKTYKVHLDGYNLIPFFKGEVKESPRKGFIYWSDDGDVFAIRVGRWKVVFLEQLHEGLDVWRLGFEKLRVPKMFDMLADPFERGDSSLLYDKWMVDRVFLTYGANAIVAEWLQSFKEFPPRQKPASFNLDEVMRKLSSPPSGHD
jgi:arylsulfatase